MNDHSAIISGVITALKLRNDLFPDEIHYNEHRRQSSDELIDRYRITDALAAYAYIEPMPRDVIVEKSARAPFFSLLRRQFKLLSDCHECDRGALLNFCYNAVEKSAGCSVTSYTDDSQRIYKEETGSDAQADLNLIRIVFEAVTIATKCDDKCISLCSTPDCLP